MNLPDISYQSFCWVIGTTSFRTAKLNLKIEQQLLLLDKLSKHLSTQGRKWVWNNDLQAEFYDLLHEEGFLTGNAPRKDKDARQKTSGLVDIGLVTNDRQLTPIGKILLNLAKNNDFSKDNQFHLEKDSYLYLKQLLKTTLSVGENSVRPYFVLAYLLSELKYLSYNEFRYFMPLCISEKTTNNIIELIKKYRSKEIGLIDVIYHNLLELENYKLAYKILLSNKVSESLICAIGINRKSPEYDKAYYQLYVSLDKFFIQENITALELFNAIKKTKQKTKWNNLIFGKSNVSRIKKLNKESISSYCPFLNCKNENELKMVFFKYLHTFKAMATLEDYFDLNRRYFNLTDTVIFSDQKVIFDLIPRYFFENCYQQLFKSTFTENKSLHKDIDLTEIDPALLFDEKSIYAQIHRDYQVSVENSEQAAQLVDDLRLKRFKELVNLRFNKDILIKLLSHFENRNDNEIAELVTDEADTPTIFEYILAIIWYEISEQKGNILDYMKLSLSADLLPKTHAGGGYADIIYEYDKTAYYPKHSLLIEATLAESTNQRRMESEPVSRHLGEYKLKYQNPNDYSVFVATYLHRNVISDLRSWKDRIYYGRLDDEYIEGLKIMPIDTQFLRNLILSETKYKDLYSFFERQYQINSIKPLEWYENMVKEQSASYQIKR